MRNCNTKERLAMLHISLIDCLDSDLCHMFPDEWSIDGGIELTDHQHLAVSLPNGSTLRH